VWPPCFLGRRTKRREQEDGTPRTSSPSTSRFISHSMSFRLLLLVILGSNIQIGQEKENNDSLYEVARW
jgi:hypothetical protein